MSWRRYRQLIPRAALISVILALLVLLGAGWAANSYYFRPREVARRAKVTAQVAVVVTAVRQTVAAQDANATAAMADRDATANARHIAVAGTATADAVALAGSATSDAAALAGTATIKAEILRCRDIGLYDMVVDPEPVLFPPPGTVHVAGDPLPGVRATWVVTNMSECVWQGLELYPLAGGEAVAPILRREGEQVLQVEPGERVEVALAFSPWTARDLDMEWVVSVNGLSLFDQPHLRLTVVRWMTVVTPTPTLTPTSTPRGTLEMSALTGTPEHPAFTATPELPPLIESPLPTPLPADTPEPQTG